MQHRKPRVLVVSEFSQLNTGYSRYSNELLSRLFKTDKYTVGEFASYGHHSDPRAQNIPWVFYGNLPDPNNQPEVEFYNSNVNHQFGAWRINNVLCHFKPDVVLMFRDVWMDAFINESPYRKNFKIIQMPAVDAYPQQGEWLASYMDSDYILTYSNWAYDSLLLQGIPKSKLRGVASPCANTEIFRPLDKASVRRHYGIDENAFIVGGVYRNQKRKGIVEIHKCFRETLDKLPKEVADKTLLYLHTSFPDNGFHLPAILDEYNLSSKVLFTYNCKACRFHSPRFFAGARVLCPRCGAPEYRMTNTDVAIDPRELAQIYNLFDVFVAPNYLEGYCIPVIEAAACAIPVFVTNYSAMEDFPKLLGSYPINVAKFWTESETGRKWALPDENDLVAKLTKYIMSPEILKNRKRLDTINKYNNNWSWDKTAKMWMDVIDEIELRNDKETWLSPPNLHNMPQGIPDGMHNNEFVAWLMINILGKPAWTTSYLAVKMLNDLNIGATEVGGYASVFTDLSFLGSNGRMQLFGRQEAINYCVELRNKWNEAEMARWNFING